MSERLAVVRVLTNVLQNRESLSSCLPKVQAELTNTSQKAFVQAICNGVLRGYFGYLALLKILMERPLKSRDNDILYLLLIGLCELHEQRSPDYAIVSEVLVAAEQLDKPWAKRLLNGVLRNFIRGRDELLNKIATQAEAFFASPQWLIDRVKKDWPDNWQHILEAGNRQAPMILRVNTSKISRADYLALLQAENIAAKPLDIVDTALQLSEPCEVNVLPGFETGLVSVQDAAAQLAAALLAPQAGDRILDACAAPGGKTQHLLEHQPALNEIIAVELDSARTKRIEENLRRAGEIASKVILKLADAANTETWWDGKLFERILLDAPCSASGVIRRHPDIKLLRRPGDIATLAETQAMLLDKLWPLLAPGGRLLYCTCSIFSAENQQQIASFLARTPSAREIALNLPFAHACYPGSQLLPGDHEADGFYYVALEKPAAC
jgi:16S rRNA (cytosine967-C5)-methyltransferase